MSLRFSWLPLALLLGITATSCQTSKIVLEELLDKTRVEILEIALANTPKSSHGETMVVLIDPRRTQEWYYYFNLEEACRKEKLMQGDTWAIGFWKQFSFSIFGKQKVFVLHFDNDRVVHCEEQIWSRE